MYLVMLTVLGIFFYWHFKLGLVRYFDGDEFTHLHWAYSFFAGERPYTDFFYLFPPFFLYPLAYLFKIFGRTVTALLAARMFIFFVFLATSGILFLLVKKLRGVQTALLTVIIFAFLPLPADKMIEVRPDLVATGLALLGLYLFIRGYGGGGGYEGKTSKFFFLSGVSYAASMGFVPKTVFFLVPIGLLLASRYLVPPPRGSTSHTSPSVSLRPFLLGFLAVGLVLLAVIASFGNLSFAIYSMTRMAAEITSTLGTKFYMRPDLFFYPNDTYYGLPGYSWPLVINLMIYISASVWAIHRLLGFNLGGNGGSEGDKGNRSLREFLVAATFWANLTAFVYFYPLKHAQYLIPVAPFIAFYFVDLLYSVIPTEVEGSPSLSGSKSRIRERFLGYARNDMLGGIILLSILLFIAIIGFQMNQKKASWVNTATFEKINNFLRTIPPDAAVYDLTGESVFFKNGYYFCCLPYGQYEESLYFRIPDIKIEAQRRKTSYVHLGSVGRLNEIPGRDAKYIMENFTATALDKMLLIRKE